MSTLGSRNPSDLAGEGFKVNKLEETCFDANLFIRFSLLFVLGGGEVLSSQTNQNRHERKAAEEDEKRPLFGGYGRE